jgi:ATP-binding cassette subfamily B protein
LGDANSAVPELPPTWRQTLAGRLAEDEVVLAWFEPDLEPNLQYRPGLVVLTDRRLLSGTPASGRDGVWTWREWPLENVLALQTRERAGLGQIDAIGPEGRLHHWRYTAARARAAQRLARRFESYRREGALTDDRTETVCPGCGEVLRGELPECPRCQASSAAVSPASALRRLLLFARKRAGMLLLGFVLTVAGTAAGLIPPYLTQPLIDDVLIPRQSGQDVPWERVYWFLGGMLAASVLAWLLGWACNLVMSAVSERIAADLRDRTYSHLLSMSLEFFGGRRTGDLISRVGTDTDRINNFLSVNLVDFATDCLMILGTAIILFSKAPALAAVTLLPLPAALWIMTLVRERLRLGFEAGNRAWAAMTSVLADTIPGIRVVKAFSQEARERDRFARANWHVVRVNDQVNFIWSFFGPTLNFVMQLGLLVVWALGAWLVFYRDFRVGVLTMFLTYLARFYTRLEDMSRMLQATQRAAASAQRIFEILDRRPDVADPPHPIPITQLRGEIVLRDVNFRYGTRQVLHNINLHIRPGEMIGLVGQTGAGKSTLVNLICRFYDVQEGAILVDGVDIRRFRVADFRRHIGIVLQEPFLFYGTVADNIAYGQPNASRAAIIEAARAARAHDFILRLPDGYDTTVGERGQNLSGGERQRISIARALLINPAILILDEATSAVDTQTEHEIQLALENLTRGRTTIAIAHRLSTLRRADRLVVLEHGRIVEIGRHQDLLESPDGAFARYHRAQLQLAGVHP